METGVLEFWSSAITLLRLLAGLLTSELVNTKTKCTEVKKIWSPDITLLRHLAELLTPELLNYKTKCAAVLLLLAACSSDGPESIEPVVRTLEATDITRTSATLNGSIELNGDTDMPQLYFLLSSPSTALSDGGGSSNSDSVYTVSIQSPSPLERGWGEAAVASSLSPGTTYNYQLVADNGRVKLYGNTMTFITMPNMPATVGDAAVLSQGPVSAIIGFAITDDGGEALTETGCYVVEGIADNIRGAASKFTATEAAVADGQYRVVVTGLKINTAYTCFPYAKSRAGEAVGHGVSFTTSSAMTVGEAGDFAKMMSSHAGSVSSIAVAGPLNGDDLRCLRGLGLENIDITDARIVAGGGPYNESYYSEDNVVGQQLFAGCTTLTSILLPNDAMTLARDAFAGCTGLREITIPAAAETVTPSSGCTSLSEISVSAANSHFKSVDGVLTDATVSRIVWFPMGKTGSYSLPETIVSVGDYAFSECAITDFTLPDNLTALGQGVFFGSKVESVTLPDKLRTVPTATFQHCANLKTVRLGSATELISDNVFDGCPLTDLYVAATLPPVCNANAFATTGAEFTTACTLHVPQGRAKYYKANKSWNRFKNITEE